MASGSRDKTLSLPKLQNNVKRDPEAYRHEFDVQYQHFDSTLELFRIRPQKPAKHFSELVTFLSHTTPCYTTPTNNVGERFAERILAILGEHFSMLHPRTREVLVNALILLRNRQQISTLRVLPMYFRLFRCPDKELRKQIYTHVVRDIASLGVKQKDQKLHSELKSFLFDHMKDADAAVSRRALGVMVELYKRRVWIDEKTVNMVAAGCLAPDLKTAAAAAQFILGNLTSAAERLESESEGEAETVRKVAKDLMGPKKSRGREKKLKKLKGTVEKAAKRKARKKSGMEATISFAAMDVLYDPHGLAEQIFSRVTGRHEPFKFRLLLLNVVSRLIGRHKLVLLNFYPHMQKLLFPHQREVTQVLACLAQGCHELVPPEELIPVTKTITQNFVSESQHPSVIAVGLNAIREICARSPLAVDDDMLTDLTGFRDVKDKSVQVAVKSLINLFRDVNPQALHRSLRGKDASLLLQGTEGDEKRPSFGASKVATSVAGLELVAQKKMLREALREEAGKRRQQGGEGSVMRDEEMDSDGSEGGVSEDEDEEEEDLDLDGMDLDEAEEVEEGEEADEEDEGDESEDDDEEEEDGEDEEGVKVTPPAAKKAKKEKEDEEGGMDDGPGRETAADREARREADERSKRTASSEAQLLSMTELLGPEDFEKIRKLQLKEESLRAMGAAKRKRVEAEERARVIEKIRMDADAEEDQEESEEEDESEEESEESSDEEMDSEDEAMLHTKTARERKKNENFVGVDAVRPDSLMSRAKKKKASKEERLAAVKEGREGRGKYQSKIKGAPHSLPESVKRRSKPMSMIRQKTALQNKKKADVQSKLKSLRAHIKNLKVKKGGKQKRRRG
uniref:Protein SDA1 n=1 Tax=Chromera velia CCMP2878 TaxID=1169474 RepID=A0A0G4FG99_9ALVE|eukprot:Cvel_16761.t1-p1 / transcript=Cvel_16761.t1 / gene=Cvel_16761 / organism=Chromera_velia_CCMP2878 / gene_product=Protein SDA1 homolog, putative / transcript_product=Protein SDA1 homolog, putative / location=Cvel_scaffold1307:11560-19718(-) / protein_length=851 / sequence_SO=supercontig / SO=protein_coding / is_pseudo=false